MSSKSLIPYYGGKSQLADWIIRHFPKDYRDLHYVEPFAGGLSVLFKKDLHKSRLESINDLDNMLINFYEVLKDKEMSKELFKIAETSLHSESLSRHYFKEIRKHGFKIEDKEKVKLAYYFFYTYCFSFNAMLNYNTWSYMKYPNNENPNIKLFLNKVFNINNYHLRFKKVQIFCRDALRVIKNTDTEQTFFYLDPPYPGADQKYLFKYNEKDFNELIYVLKGIKGKFLLSFYRQKFMDFPKHWILSYKKTTTILNQKDKNDTRRIETLARNYGI